VEAVVHRVHSNKSSAQPADALVLDVTQKVFRSAAFGVLIILVVLFPVLTLGGIEGKMFRPMVQTVSFALIGALLLSVTFVPVASSLWLTRDFKEWTITQRLVSTLQRWFQPALQSGLNHPKRWLAASVLAFALAVGWFTQLGAVFLPTLEEGDLAMQLSVAPGSTLEHSIETCSQAERILMERFPEVKHVVSKIGTAEVPTDPMGIEDADVMIILKPKEEWVSASNREDLVALMKEALAPLEGAEMEFTQPIQLRFNELLTGAKSDLALKIFGPDHEVLHQTAERLAEAVRPLEGVADLRVERTEGMNTLTVVPNRFRMSQFGITVEEVNQVLQTAFSGMVVGKAFEADRSLDVVVRADQASRQQFDLTDYHLLTPQGERVPLSELVTVTTGQGPLQISREQGMRRIVVGINVRNRDVESLVNDIKQLSAQSGMLPPGYSLAFDGQFKNLEQARNRLAIAVPLALGLILVLLFFAFRSMKYALMIFLAVPLSSIGGVWALGLRGMPFSISAGVGFIALFGVAVLNGIVLVSHMNDLRTGGMPLREVLLRGPLDRLRPVLMTAAVAALGFLPMALSNGAGAEVQRPLATVVIGGLVSATLLTLVLLPVMYGLLNRPGKMHLGRLLGLVAVLGSTQVSGQNYLTADKAVEWAMVHNPELRLMEMEAKAAKAGVKQAYDVAPVAVDVTYGQINEYTRDYNIAVYQSLGSILQNVKNAKALKAGVVERQATVAYQRRETEYLVRLAYEGWMHAVRQEAEVSRDEVRFRAMTDIIEVGYKTGNISSMDRAAARGKWAAYRNRLSDARAFRASKEREFMHLLLYSDTLVAPEDWPILVPRSDTGALPPVLIEPYLKRAEVAKYRYQAHKAEYFPELTVGYFNQSIGLISGFEGVSLGVSFPLWFRPTQGRIQQAGIEAEAAVLEAEVTALRWEQLRKEAYSQLWYHHQRLEDYRDASFEDAIMLYETSITAFQSGETDVFRLFDAFLTVIDLKLEYLALVEAHNSAVLTVNYLSEFE
jgi:cobalt-zinc-cadmium resistance protein CzcA